MKRKYGIFFAAFFVCANAFASQPAASIRGVYFLDVKVMGVTLRNLLDIDRVDEAGNFAGTVTVPGTSSSRFNGRLSAAGDFIFTVGNQKGTAEFSGKIESSNPPEFVGTYKGATPTGPLVAPFSTTKLMEVKRCKGLLQKCVGG